MSQKLHRILPIITLLILASLACAGSGQDSPPPPAEVLDDPTVANPTVLPPEEPAATSTLPPEPTQAEAPADPPTPEEAPEEPAPAAGPVQSGPPVVGEPAFETDFTAGWPSEEYKGFGHVKVVGGGYEMYSILQGLWMVTTRVALSEFYVEVEATPTQCPVEQAWYGVVFHYRGMENFRFFVVTCSGKWALFERSGASVAAKIEDGDVSAEIDVAHGTHTIGVLADNNVLTLFADHYELAKVGVSDMPDGDISPYVETKGAPILVTFSRMAIYHTE